MVIGIDIVQLYKCESELLLPELGANMLFGYIMLRISLRGRSFLLHY
jgi:hypothetical protein